MTFIDVKDLIGKAFNIHDDDDNVYEITVMNAIKFF